MKIEIEWMSDDTDCETCGSSWATGAVVKIDGEVVIDMTPAAACYDGVSYEESQVYAALLKHLGHEIQESHVDIGYNQHNYQEDDDD